MSALLQVNQTVNRATNMFKSRLGILALLLGCGFIAVGARLFQLQIVRYEKYMKLVERDRDPEQCVGAVRGSIFDRFGEVLAEDRPFYDISVRVDRLKLIHTDVNAIMAMAKRYRPPVVRDENYEQTVQKLRAEREIEFGRLTTHVVEEPFVRELARTLNRDENEITAGLTKALDCISRDWAAPRTPLRIVSGIPEKLWLGLRAIHEDAFRDSRQMFGASADKYENAPLPPFPGLVCTISTRRVYPFNNTAAFALGAVGEITPDEEDVLRREGVLFENAEARERYWDKLRGEMDSGTASRLEAILHVDPREIERLGDLYEALTRLTPDERQQVAALGLGEPLRWSERPPRMKLTEPELTWLGVGLPTNVSKNSLPIRVVGELGVERYFNDYLRGKAGMRIAGSFDDEELEFRNNSRPQEGHGLALTVSLSWQRAVENALKSQDKPGAIVVLDVKTGDVLAIASWPDFDPNLFSPPRDGVQRQEKLKALLENPSKPLLNRAVAEQYPLGSVMKSLIAAVALEKNLVNTTETFECPGYIIEGGQKFRCDDSRAHGTVNLMKGLRCSCNVTFHQIGARIGVENLAPYARAIFGKRTGIDIPGEAAGIYPDRAWRMKTFPNNPAARVWTRGNDFLLAIGQGQFTSTVVQAAVLMATLSNGGYVVTPRLSLDSPPVQPKSLGISPANLAIVRQGLEEVVNVGRPGERGTAYSPFHEQGPQLPIKVAGKTSTAEHRHGATPHAWFAGYAPADNPQIAFAVLIEEGGHGGAAAAPVAYKFLKEIYGTKSQPNQNPGGPISVPVAQRE